VSARRAWLTFTLLLVFASPGLVVGQQPPAPEDRVVPDFDIRERRPRVALGQQARAAVERLRAERGQISIRRHPVTGAVRAAAARPGTSLSSPGRGPARTVAEQFLRARLDLLGLDPDDQRTLVASREYWTRDTGLRHVFWTQAIDGIPVFDAVVGVHLGADGSVLRVTSSAASGRGRRREASIDAEEAAERAKADIGAEGTVEHIDAGLTWFPIDGRLRLAWHVIVDPGGFPQMYDILVDAESGELLLRRNRVRYADGIGRVLQSPGTAVQDQRRPDPRPLGSDGTATGCPPVSNHAMQSLTSQFRDPATVLGNNGRLSGNNTRVFRQDPNVEGALGSFDGAAWLFDFPFNTADAAETALFFAANFAHDFFYDLGFDEAAGNFQMDNFGRGGSGGDAVVALARAAGRNNATWLQQPDGQSPTMSMFLWDGSGCWSEDVNGDGSQDLDGDLDFDIIIHEYHHGVSLRLNTSWTGNEAGAMGEGGGDFFAYSVNGDTVLAEYSRPGGIRSINAKTYADWTCLFGLFCQVHDNGQIWANVLWDSRERFRTDMVTGSEEGGVRELHQVYIDGLKLSPPAPTMLDMRDAMLQADAIRNPLGDRSQNFCRLWESFAGRGMGVNASDTSENVLNQVVADSTVPAGCNAPPPPPTVSIVTVNATATEAGRVPASFRISRDGDTNAALMVNIQVGGLASLADYDPIAGDVTIPAGASDTLLLITPVDDAIVESNESLIVSLRPAGRYVIGTPASATATIVSDDVAPDLQVTVFTAPAGAAPGASISVSDTTANTGAGNAPETRTVFYLSLNLVLDANDPVLGERAVPALAAGASSQQTTIVQIPASTAPGTYYLFAKVDPDNVIVETAEYNNGRARSIAIGPDLVVSAMSAPSTTAPGAAILVSDTTGNQGTAAAAASVTRFYLSTNFLFDASDTLLQGSRPVAALPAGASSSGTTFVTIPSNLATGTYYLLAHADGAQQVGEASETNNIRWQPLQIGGDLVVTALSASPRAAAGGTLAISDTTRNQGAAAVGASTTAFYLSTNYILDAMDPRLGTGRAIAALAAGNSSAGTTVVTIPADTPAGLWILFAKADADSAVAETQESNNARSMTIQIGPDLGISSISSLPSTPAGGTFTITETVNNRGAGAAPASRVRYYLSTDVLLNAAVDTLLSAGRDVPALAAGASSAGSTVLTLPTGIAAGQYFIIAMADGDQTVREAVETNNTAVRGIVVTN
jgi:subtilase family serine protease